MRRLVYINPPFHSIDCAIISTFVFFLRSCITFCRAVSKKKRNFHKTRLLWTMSQQTTFILHFFGWLSTFLHVVENMKIIFLDFRPFLLLLAMSFRLQEIEINKVPRRYVSSFWLYDEWNHSRYIAITVFLINRITK